MFVQKEKEVVCFNHYLKFLGTSLTSESKKLDPQILIFYFRIKHKMFTKKFKFKYSLKDFFTLMSLEYTRINKENIYASSSFYKHLSTFYDYLVAFSFISMFDFLNLYNFYFYQVKAHIELNPYRKRNMGVLNRWKVLKDIKKNLNYRNIEMSEFSMFCDTILRNLLRRSYVLLIDRKKIKGSKITKKFELEFIVNLYNFIVLFKNDVPSHRLNEYDMPHFFPDHHDVNKLTSKNFGFNQLLKYNFNRFLQNEELGKHPVFSGKFWEIFVTYSQYRFLKVMKPLDRVKCLFIAKIYTNSIKKKKFIFRYIAKQKLICFANFYLDVVCCKDFIYVSSDMPRLTFYDANMLPDAEDIKKSTPKVFELNRKTIFTEFRLKYQHFDIRYDIYFDRKYLFAFLNVPHNFTLLPEGTIVEDFENMVKK